MALEISALVFDAYGTLFDVHSVTRLADTLFPGRGAALSAAWRTKQLEYTWLRSLMDRYEDFNRVTTASLDWSLEHLGLEADEAARRALVAEYRTLSVFTEVPAALDAMARQRPLAILSNGHPEMLEAVVEHNKLRNLFRGGVLSVHAAKVFKPHPSVYALAENRLGVPADFAIERQEQTQHAVCGRVLRAHVDDHFVGFEIRLSGKLGGHFENLFIACCADSCRSGCRQAACNHA